MAKISNQTAYPAITPLAGDYLVLTDVSDSNKTKTVTVQSIADFVDGEVTLQEVLDASDPLNTPPTAVAIGNITLTGEFASPAGSNVTIKTLGLADDIDLTAGLTSGRVSLKGAGIFGEAEDIAFTASVGDIDIAATGVNGDIKIKAGDKAIMSANGSSYGGQPAGTAMLYNQNDDVHINANNGRIIIGGSYPSKPIKIDIGPTSGDIDIWAFDGISNINLTATTGKIESHSTHDFSFNNGIFLAGVAGVAGEVIASEGAGAPLAWKTPLSLLPLPTSNVFAGDATNTPVATNKVLIDLAPAAGLPDVTIGTATTLTLQSGMYYADVRHPIGISNLSYGQQSLTQPVIGGTQNTGLGIAALEKLLGGNENTALGYRTLTELQNTHQNTAVGCSALVGALPGSIGESNTAIGTNSMRFMNSNTANFNVGVGTYSLGGIVSGTGNIGIGHDAGFSITTGDSNIAIGKDAMLIGALGATGNVVIGDSAAQNISSALNTLIGTSTAATLTTGTNNVLLGDGTNVTHFNDSGAVAIGSGSVAGALSVSLGQGSSSEISGTSLGNLAISQPSCVAIGQGSFGQTNIITGQPVINISLWNQMTTVHIFDDNTTALAGGLHAGDLYCVNPLTIAADPLIGGTLPGIGGAGGPAIIAVVYAM